MAETPSSGSWTDEHDDLAQAYLQPVMSDDGPYWAGTGRTHAPCRCDECARLKRAADQMDEIQCWTDEAVSDSITEAQQAIWRARRALHKLHMPELYLTDEPVTLDERFGTRKYVWTELVPCDCAECDILFRRHAEEELAFRDGGDYKWYVRALGLIVAAQTALHSNLEFIQSSGDEEFEYSGSDTELEYTSRGTRYRGRQQRTFDTGTTDRGHVTHGGHHNKYMVCDHCMAHALPCNEASVCDQCQLFEQPCVHRWCRDSPASKAQCQNNDCRYAHRDAVVARAKEPRWIVLPGKITEYMSRTRIASRTFRSQPDGLTWTERFLMLDERQEGAIGELRAAVAVQEGSLLSYRFSCTCANDAEEWDDNYEHVTVESCPLRCQQAVDPFDGHFSYLNDFLPTNQHSAAGSEVSGETALRDGNVSSANDTDGVGSCLRCGAIDGYYSVAECDHRTCIECAIDLYPMDGTDACFQCGQVVGTIWWTNAAHKTYRHLNDQLSGGGEIMAITPRLSGDLKFCVDNEEVDMYSLALLESKGIIVRQ